MAFGKVSGLKDCFDQLVPSREVSTVPRLPAATNRPLPKAMASRWLSTPELWTTQFPPSDEVRMAPASPTATNRPLPKAAALRLLACGKGLRHVHESSGPGAGTVKIA